MRVSKYLLPLLKENPQEAKIVSHRLMLRAGMIQQVTAGIYDWLPLGNRVLQKVAAIIRDEMDKIGCVEVTMPTMQPKSLWDESGRGDYGKETLRASDRHDREMIYGPTHEEVVTDIFRKHVKSHKQVPLTLYQIQWKFRDEIRPRFGVMRGREFLMKDAYSFTVGEEEHIELYYKMYKTYFKIFRRMGLSVIPFAADTGMIGGNLSHEFQVIAETGESEIFYDAEFENLVNADELDIEKLKTLYSAADDKHDADNCPVAAENLRSARGIEVGHIFFLGDKYTKAMGAKLCDKDGNEAPAMMGCHGIGVSRLLGAIIEANHDENGIIWPESVAPFKVGIINIRQGDEQCDAMCEDIYAKLQEAGVEVLYHDTDERAGVKFGSMDLIGLPYQVIVGPRGAKAGVVEFKSRRSGEKQELSVQEVIEVLAG